MKCRQVVIYARVLAGRIRIRSPIFASPRSLLFFDNLMHPGPNSNAVSSAKTASNACRLAPSGTLPSLPFTFQSLSPCAFLTFHILLKLTLILINIISVSFFSPKPYIYVLSGVLLMSQANPVSTSAEPTPDERIPYKQVEGRTLTLHLFLPESTGREESNRPIVVFFHGGGWNGGSPAQFYPQSAFLRDRGLICISAEYRVSKTDGTTPYEAIQDAFDAMRFVRHHAKGWGGDPNRIAAAGGSAGGHLAAATASLTAEDLAGVHEEASKARPNLLLLFNPVSDNGPENFGHEQLGNRWKEASPAHNLHADLPPTLVMLGDSDNLIPVETAERFSANLKALNVPNHLVIYPGGEHGFFNPGKQDGIFYSQTLAETERFLVKYGWLRKGRDGNTAEDGNE